MRYLKKMNVSNVITTASLLIIIITAMIDDFEFGLLMMTLLVLFILSFLWIIRLAIKDDYERGDEDD